MTHTVSGTVSGLASGAKLMLEDNGGDALTVTADGAFTFATPIADGGSYGVTVSSQPAAQTCTAANASGDHVTANVSGVTVTCSNNPVTISGTVSGLTAGTQVVLNDNGGDPLTVAANGNFTFATPVAYNGTYAVTVATQPLGQICTVANFTAANVTANVSNVNVVCSAGTYTIGGTITGLGSGVQLTLENNGSDPITITADGPFHFPTPVAYTGSYVVTVAARPSAQVCSITGGSGTGVAADVSNLAVSCGASPGFVYATSQTGSVVEQFTMGADGTLTPMTPATVTTGSNALFMAVEPQGRYAYAISGNDRFIWPYAIGPNGALTPIVDPSTNEPHTPTGSGPEAIAVHPNGKYVYVVNQSGSISQYIIETNGALQQMTPPTVAAGGAPFAMTINAAGTFAYVANETSRTIWSYSIGSDGALTLLVTGGGAAASVSTPSFATGIAVDPAGKHAYALSSVLNAGNDTVVEFDVQTDGTLQPILDGSSNPVTIPAGTLAANITVDAAGKNVYVANSSSSTVSQYGIELDGTLTHIADVLTATGGGASIMTLDPQGKYAYVTNEVDRIFQYGIGTDGTLQALATPDFLFPLDPVSGLEIRPLGIAVTR